MPTPYINAVELDIVPAEYEKFKAAILENAAASVKEPGCRQFDVLFEDSDPHHVFLYEVYDDETALEAHRATAHFKKFRETTTPMIAKRVARHMSPIAFKHQESGEAAMKTGLLATFLLLVTVPAAAPQPALVELLARAKSLELDTPYVPPPGDPLAHHAAGYAKVMCSAVFMTGLTPDFAAENVGFFTAPYEVRGMLGKPVIDRANQTVDVKLPNGVTRTAKYLGSQGCVTLPLGATAVNFTPVIVKSQLPDPETQPWPMGDVLPKGPRRSTLPN